MQIHARVTASTSPDQRRLYDVVTNHYLAELSPELPALPQLLLNLDGVAGSGKTFV